MDGQRTQDMWSKSTFKMWSNNAAELQMEFRVSQSDFTHRMMRDWRLDMSDFVDVTDRLGVSYMGEECDLLTQL